VAKYLTLRLEAAERYTSVRFVDPDLPPLSPVAWHKRYDPGAAQLAWLTHDVSLDIHSHFHVAPQPSHHHMWDDGRTTLLCAMRMTVRPAPGLVFSTVRLVGVWLVRLSPVDSPEATGISVAPMRCW
jgi:hypothetical protein